MTWRPLRIEQVVDSESINKIQVCDDDFTEPASGGNFLLFWQDTSLQKMSGEED